MNNDMTPFSELIDRIHHALERPIVQSQLSGILFSLLCAWLLTRVIQKLWSQKFSSLENKLKSKPKQKAINYISLFISHCLVSVLMLLSTKLLNFFFIQLQWPSGLIVMAISLCGTFVFYRLFLLIGYLIFPSEAVDRYRWLYFTPLLFVFVVRIIISLLFDVQNLFDIKVIRLFGDFINLGSIFVFTIGIYFWVMGVCLIEEIFLYVAYVITKEETNTGGVKASSIIIRYTLIGLGIVLFCGYVGFDSNALAAISGGLSVGIGFSLKEVISNFFSGLGLLFEGSVRPGDIVEVDGEITRVETVSIRATRVKTFDNTEKIIPNELFYTNAITTYTGTDSIVRVVVLVGVSYKCDPEMVIQILLDVAKKNKYICSNPLPYVHLLGYGDFSVDFRLFVFINDPLIQLTVKSILYREIWKAFKENKIEIPYPQRDLHIRSDLTNPQENLKPPQFIRYLGSALFLSSLVLLIS